jgi:hypothetical protein
MWRSLVSLEIHDPRIPHTTDQVSLASRDRQGAVMLVDNGKLGEGYGQYAVLFDTFAACFANLTVDVPTVRTRRDLIGHNEEGLKTVAAELAREEPRAVVLALCDWGVSFATAIVAIELERIGVPTAVIGTAAGYWLVASLVARIAPGLPVLRTNLLRGADADELEAEARTLFPAVEQATLKCSDGVTLRFAQGREPRIPVADPSGRLTLSSNDPVEEFTAGLGREGLGDGFPLIPPTIGRVEDFLKAAGWMPGAVLWPQVFPRPRAVTAQDLATIAVMAGCQARWAPVVFAAYEAMAEDEFRLFAAAMTTFPGGTLVLVSGPRAADFGIASGRGALGPGFAANATIGRAIALSYSFALGAQPGSTDLTAQGSPAEYSYCCAENLDESPWSGVHADLGYPGSTTVTVVKCEGPHSILDQKSSDPKALLDTFASTLATLGGNPVYAPSCQMPLLMNPEHAQLLAQGGWSKPDVQRYLFETARNNRADVEPRGIDPKWPVWLHSLERVPVVDRPENLLIAVVGGSGPTSQVALPWGYARAVTKEILVNRAR